MYADTDTGQIEWSAAQACAECGTDAAYVRAEHGEAICRECGHENPMDTWHLDSGEVFEWHHIDGAALVLFVTAYAVEES